MTRDQETELADRVTGVYTNALVVADADMGRNWLPCRRTAADLARGAGLPPLTQTEARIAANIASVLGGYRGRPAAWPGTWD